MGASSHRNAAGAGGGLAVVGRHARDAAGRAGNSHGWTSRPDPCLPGDAEVRPNNQWIRGSTLVIHGCRYVGGCILPTSKYTNSRVWQKNFTYACVVYCACSECALRGVIYRKFLHSESQDLHLHAGGRGKTAVLCWLGDPTQLRQCHLQCEGQGQYSAYCKEKRAILERIVRPTVPPVGEARRGRESLGSAASVQLLRQFTSEQSPQPPGHLGGVYSGNFWCPLAHCVTAQAGWKELTSEDQVQRTPKGRAARKVKV